MITSVRDWIDRLEAEYQERKASPAKHESSPEILSRATRRRRPHREERIRSEEEALPRAERSFEEPGYEYEEVMLAPESASAHLVPIRPRRKKGSDVDEESEPAASPEPKELPSFDEIPGNIFTEIATPEPELGGEELTGQGEERVPAEDGEAPVLIQEIAREAGISDLVAEHINGRWQGDTPAETLVTALEGLAAAASEGGSPDEAIRLYQDAVGIANRGHLPGSLQAQIHGRLAGAYVEVDDFPRATESFEAAIRLYFEAGHHQYRAELIRLYNGLGLIFKAHRRYEEGETCYHQAIQLQEQHDRQGALELAVLHNNLGCLYYSAGHYSMATNVHRRSLEYRMAVPERDAGLLAESHRNLALSALAAEDWSCAHKHLHEALNGYHQDGPGHEQQNIELLLSLAALHDEQGSYGDAEMVLIEAINQYESMVSQPDPMVATMFNNLGSVYAKSGYTKESRRMFERSLEIRESTVTTHRADLAVVFSNLGAVNQELGRRHQAELYFQRAINLFEQSEKAASAAHDHVTSLYHDLLRPEANRVNAPMSEKLLTRSIEESNREQATFLI